MRIEGPALLVRIYIGEADHRDGKPLYQAIVAFLRERGLAGATVLRGIEGFGANAHLHTARSASHGAGHAQKAAEPGGGCGGAVSCGGGVVDSHATRRDG